MRAVSEKSKSSIENALPDNFLAKTIKISETCNVAGISVEAHALIVGSVCKALADLYPPSMRSDLFPKAGIELLASAHDIGKISPCFQEKLYSAIGEPHGLGNPALDTIIGGHAAVSQATLKNSGESVAKIAGRHHGSSPAKDLNATDEVCGGEIWEEQRQLLLSRLKVKFGEIWPEVKSQEVFDFLSGLTTVSDWIGSGSIFDGKEDNWKELVPQAIQDAGFERVHVRKGLTFSQIFPFKPNEVQQAFINEAISQGVYVLEAPMGLGKTECALYAAYKAMEKGDATGIYFALPTQLTSNNMHIRVNDFLKKILDIQEAYLPARLLHSGAWLRNIDMGEDASPGHSWFDSAKRGLLAPFAVGTIDQALMAVMNVRHGFVRSFGLAGKVVILDEVHSYDSYTGTILSKLVKALRELHCTVIVLSATLTAKQRLSIISDNKCFPKSSIKDDYPLISIYRREDTNILEVATAHPKDVTVQLKVGVSDQDAFNEVILRAARGEQVLWIENTVIEAQSTYRILASRISGNIRHKLLHSRFLKSDREHIEKEWVSAYGKEGYEKRKEGGRILVGTQILEQSIDIDADFLVSRLAPSDMLFQRIGRLWRHTANNAIRPLEASREAWIVSAESDDTEKPFGKTGYVYAPYVLFRTLEIWGKLRSVQIPTDIRPIIEKTYSEQKETALSEYKYKLEQRREELSRFAMAGMSVMGQTLSDANPPTRYSEENTLDVLLVKAVRQTADGHKIIMLDDSVIQVMNNEQNSKLQRDIAVKIMEQTVKVFERHAPEALKIPWIGRYVYLGDNPENPSFRIAVLQEDNSITLLDGSSANQSFNLEYSHELGYAANKKCASSPEFVGKSWFR